MSVPKETEAAYADKENESTVFLTGTAEQKSLLRQRVHRNANILIEQNNPQESKKPMTDADLLDFITCCNPLNRHERRETWSE